MKSACHLAMFAKFWQPGQVKTRLAAGVGIQAASQIYFQFLNHLIRELAGCGDQRTVVFHPINRRREFATLCSRHQAMDRSAAAEVRTPDQNADIGFSLWDLQPQSDGDLGSKLSTFFASAFQENGIESGDFDSRLDTSILKQKIVVIGSDCPLIAPADIETAFAKLDHQPVVLGPSGDGGYYLIGLSQPCPEIFNSITWSTSSVLAETIGILERRKIGFEWLPEISDIDEVEDYQALLSELKLRGLRNEPAAMRLMNCLADLEPTE